MNGARITQLIAVPVIIASLGGVAAATQGRTASSATASAAQVRAAERSVLRATVDADAQTLRTALAPDFQQIDVTGSNNTRSDYLSLVAGPVDFKQLRPISPIQVRVHGSSAVARVELAFKVVARGQTLEHHGWNTDLFERRGGRWQLVWSQTTAVPNNIAFLIKALQPTP